MSKRNTWKKWDTFYYKIESENEIINNRYLLFVKVDEAQWYEKYSYPIFRVLITKNDKLPSSFEEVNNLEHVQTSQVYWYKRWDSPESFGDNYYQIIKERCSMKYYPDELHFLKIYLAAIWIDGRKSIPDNWYYLGNYPITNLPKDEFVPYTQNKIQENSYYWRSTGRNDIKRMVQNYLDYNLKGIYPELKKNIKKTKKASMFWAITQISVYFLKTGGIEKEENEKILNELLDMITTIDGKVEDLDIRKELLIVSKVAERELKNNNPEDFDENGNCIYF